MRYYEIATKGIAFGSRFFHQPAAKSLILLVFFELGIVFLTVPSAPPVLKDLLLLKLQQVLFTFQTMALITSILACQPGLSSPKLCATLVELKNAFCSLTYRLQCSAV